MLLPIQWRPKYIKGYEGKYAVCRAGYVFSFKSWRFLKGNTDKDGYKYVSFYKNNKPKHYKVHRLVAEAFIPNPNNWPQVNHKNEVKNDNRVCNLEWCTAKYNRNYGTSTERQREAMKGHEAWNKGKKMNEECKRKMKENHADFKGKNHPQSKAVLMFDLNGTFIRRFDYAGDANEFLGKNRANSNISLCARGISKTAWGYKWKYEKDCK